MNYPLAREIYGGEPWLIDPVSFSSLFNILTDFRNGVELKLDGDEKLNSIAAMQVNSATRLANRSYQLSKFDDDAEIVSVVNLNGPITKNGGASSHGMRQLSMEMNRMTKDDRVKGHIIVTDSGGGASNAVGFMADAIKASQAAGKPVIQFIEKGGLSASAAFFIGSYADFIFSETKDNRVGSLGTMIEFKGIPKGVVEGKDGVINVRAYATASVNKNVEFEAALEGNLEPITSNLLDPINEDFLNTVKQNRPNVTEEQLTGSVYKAGEVVGSLVDSIGSFGDAINKVLELNQSGEIKNFTQAATGPTNKSLIIKKEGMDLSQLKSEHPAVYQAAFAEGEASGAAKEKDRVGAWMAHSKTDIEAVKAGIEGGTGISATQREELLVKGASLTHVEKIKEDAAPPANTPESKTGAEAKEEDVDNFYGEIDKKLGLTIKED